MILFHPKFEGEEYRTFRAWTFICTGLSSLAPLMHAIILYGLEEMMEHGGLPYYLLEGLLHIIGVAFYVVSMLPRLFLINITCVILHSFLTSIHAMGTSPSLSLLA